MKAKGSMENFGRLLPFRFHLDGEAKTQAH